MPKQPMVHGGALLEPVERGWKTYDNCIHRTVAQRFADAAGMLPRDLYRALVWWGKNEGPIPRVHMHTLLRYGVVEFDEYHQHWAIRKRAGLDRLAGEKGGA